MLTVRSEAGVGPQLKPEPLRGERDGCVLARNREHGNADVVHLSPFPSASDLKTQRPTSYEGSCCAVGANSGNQSPMGTFTAVASIASLMSAFGRVRLAKRTGPVALVAYSTRMDAR